MPGIGVGIAVGLDMETVSSGIIPDNALLNEDSNPLLNEDGTILENES